MGASTQPPNPASPRQSNKAPKDWEDWLRAFFPAYLADSTGEPVPFGAHHRELWEWVWALRKGHVARPFVGIWPRGGAKSTNAELACVALGARGHRRYVLYVSETQAQADNHVSTVGAMLESPEFAAVYPDMARRAVTQYGSSKGWRRNRLRTDSGFTIDAIGLDTAARGVKMDADRPDLIVLDDLDDASDNPNVTVPKKIAALTKRILPSGSEDAGVLAVQNLVREDGIFGQLAGGEADFLQERIVSGPHKALVGLQYEKRDGRTILLGGSPIWIGQDLARCQSMVDRIGIRAFLTECQHERALPEGQAFPEWDDAIHVCDRFDVPAAWPRWRAVDWGYAVPFCGLWATRAPWGQVFIYREVYEIGMLTAAQADLLRRLSKGEQIRRTWGDPNSFWAKTRNGLPVRALAQEYAENGVALTPGNDNRRAGWDLLHKLLAFQMDRVDVIDGVSVPVPGYEPRLKVFRTCRNLVRTMPLLPQDTNNPDDVDTDAEDHAADTLRYLAMGLYVQRDKQKPAHTPYGMGKRRAA